MHLMSVQRALPNNCCEQGFGSPISGRDASLKAGGACTPVAFTPTCPACPIAVHSSILPVPCITFSQLRLPCYSFPCLFTLSLEVPSSSPDLTLKPRSLASSFRPLRSFNPFSFKLLRTLLCTGAPVTLFLSIACALFLSPRGCIPLPLFFTLSRCERTHASRNFLP